VFELLRPVLEDLLVLETNYETAFDDFEVLMAIQHADFYAAECSGGAWGPLGRFAWKFHSGDMRSPFYRRLADAERDRSTWVPIRAGMFQGSLERFREIATSFGKTVAVSAGISRRRAVGINTKFDWYRTGLPPRVNAGEPIPG
jgi:hypothetical protein